MAYIKLENEEYLPGIRGLMAFSPDTSKPMNLLADTLLCRPERGTLSKGDRELIGAYTSYLNDCHFCQNVHGAAASCQFEDGGTAFSQVKKNVDQAEIPDKLKALLHIAAAVQKGGKNVSQDQIDLARSLGSTDNDIHDTVLIAAAFCMFNRYVDGLNTWAPQNQEAYDESGERIKRDGYANFDPKKLIKK
ncbi:peroxidase-related enzyme [Marinilongibacter aquaticus]|uniref:carboxymuconolactone decarboxylase family protein n=1 Tax=Marinilongibacter aquaticus TaxID=2975157 RepID=UPI0021BDD8A9|nr:peroxidase-related enzyme [Marinilongibacter aquaticus]UBM58183.1 peroxidase-related enzyme [Marinilongibacter aquaticus]